MTENKKKECSIEECNKEPYAKGLCRKHYSKEWYRREGNSKRALKHQRDYELRDCYLEREELLLRLKKVCSRIEILEARDYENENVGSRVRRLD